MVGKGTFVRIEKTILKPEERTSKIPDDTKKVPFKMWTKGFLQHDCEMNGEAAIITVARRQDTGTLVEVHPFYELNYGEFLPEIAEIDKVIKDERQ